MPKRESSKLPPRRNINPLIRGRTPEDIDEELRRTAFNTHEITKAIASERDRQNRIAQGTERLRTRSQTRQAKDRSALTLGELKSLDRSVGKNARKLSMAALPRRPMERGDPVAPRS